MNYEKFLKDNLIKKQRPDFNKISPEAARKLIAEISALIKSENPEKDLFDR